MNKDKLTAKQQSAVEFYCNKASDTFNIWTASYKKANYSLCTGWKHNAIRVLHKDYIQRAIEQYRAKNKVKLEYNRQIALEQLDTVISNLTPEAKGGNVSANTALTQAIREKNAITGLHSVTNINRNEDKPRDLTDEQRQELKRAALVLTNIKLRTG